MTRSITRAPSPRRLAAFALPAVLAAGLVAGGTTVAYAADEPIDGARTSGDAMFPNVGNGGYDALDYDVAIAWTPDATQSGTTIAGSIVATSTMTARAAVPLKSFSLDFEGLQIDTVTVNGQPAQWQRDVDASAIKYKLIVTPATPVSGEFTTTVTYHGVPNSHTDADGSSEGWNRTSDGATFLGQPVGSMTGYPHNNTPADKATYTFTLDIPTTLNTVAGTAPGPAAAVSNGELISKTPSTDGTRTTWVWDQKKQMASELAVISIGRFDTIESQVTLTDGRVIPSWSFMDYGLSTQNKATITNRVTQLQPIIRNLETLYGPYPGNSTGVLVDTVPSGINYALETQDRSFFPSTNSVNGSTLIHELIHQWYGDNVSPTTWTDIWIAEGMATYGTTYYSTTEAFGTGTTPSERSYYNSWNNTAATSAAWSIAPGAQTDSEYLYEFQTYTRGAQFWAALRVAIGDDAFFPLLKEWQTRYAGKSVTGADLKALAEELSGRDLTAFYQDWILDADKPAWPDKLDLSFTSDAGEDPLERGDAVTYTLSATNTGYGPLNASVITVDVASVLAKATIDPATLPAGVTLEGTTLTWAVPVTATAAPAVTTSFTATVTDVASGGIIDAIADVATLGGTCVACQIALEVEEYPVDSADPVIVGTPQVGQTLTAQTEGWTEGTEFEYAWFVDGEYLEDEFASTFTLPESSLGGIVELAVYGVAEGYIGEVRWSEPVGPVTAAPTPSPTPEPTSTAIVPIAPSDEALEPSTLGRISAPATAHPGETITVTVGAEHAGDTVYGWLFSTPTSLGSAVVSATGTIQLTIPSDTTLGVHRLAVADGAGALYGWTSITITGALAATGGTLPLDTAMWAVGLLVAGGAIAVTVAARRRRVNAE